MPATDNQPPRRPPPRPYVVGGLSMRELLASCAAADAISRPPRAPEPAAARPAPRPSARSDEDRREAA